MTRERLPDRRAHELIDLEHGGFRYVAGIGRFPDGRLAEVFINTPGKAGTGVEAIARDAAIVASLALQHGVAVETIRHAITRSSNGAAAGVVGALLDLLEGDAA